MKLYRASISWVSMCLDNKGLPDSSVPSVLPGRPVTLLNSPPAALPRGLVQLCHSFIRHKGSGNRDNAISFLSACILPECNKTVWLQSDCFYWPKILGLQTICSKMSDSKISNNELFYTQVQLLNAIKQLLDKWVTDSTGVKAHTF